MTIAAATGYISVALDAFRTTVADSTEFRKFCNPDSPVTTRDAALERLPLVVFDMPIDGKESHSVQEMATRRPYGHCWMPDEGLVISKAGFNCYTPTAMSAVIRFVRDTPEDLRGNGNAQEAERDFANTVGVIVKETLDNMGVAPYGDALRAHLVEAPGRSHPDDWESIGDIQECAWQFVMGSNI